MENPAATYATLGGTALLLLPGHQEFAFCILRPTCPCSYALNRQSLPVSMGKCFMHAMRSLPAPVGVLLACPAGLRSFLFRRTLGRFRSEEVCALICSNALAAERFCVMLAWSCHTLS